jgi:hypothetical protein
MRQYRAFYNGRIYDLQADCTYAAQQIAAQYFKAKKAYKVAVVLLDRPVDPASL